MTSSNKALLRIRKIRGSQSLAMANEEDFMTLGGFTAIATIVKARISGGLNDKGEQYIDADMELEGKLLVFHYGSLKDTLRQKTKAEVIQIEFEEYPQENYYGDDQTKYA